MDAHQATLPSFPQRSLPAAAKSKPGKPAKRLLSPRAATKTTNKPGSHRRNSTTLAHMGQRPLDPHQGRAPGPHHLREGLEGRRGPAQRLPPPGWPPPSLQTLLKVMRVWGRLPPAGSRGSASGLASLASPSPPRNAVGLELASGGWLECARWTGTHHERFVWLGFEGRQARRAG